MAKSSAKASQTSSPQSRSKTKSKESPFGAAKIRHIVFHTTDVERLAKFYVDVMGLKVKHRSENGGIALTDGYLDFSIHTNKIDGKPSGFNHFGFEVDDNDAVAAKFKEHGYRLDPDGNNFDISANGYGE